MKLSFSIQTLCLVLCVPLLRAQQPGAAPAVPPLEQKFRDGLYAEEAKQDLAGAVKAYQEIVELFDRDRETASSALFRLGEVYRKQNLRKEAASAFRRVAQEFPDRDPLARLARENLTALGEPLPEVPGAAAPAGNPEEDTILARLRTLEKDSPDLVADGLTKNGVISYQEAVAAGYVRVVQWFLDRKVSVDRTPAGTCPLSIAAGAGHLPMAAFLLERGAKIEGHEEAPYPLRAAAANGHLAMVKLLVEKGSSVKGREYEWHPEPGKTEKGWTQQPLTPAVRGGHRAVVEFLVSRKADPNESANPEGYALAAAVEAGDFPLTKLLLENGADPAKATHYFGPRQNNAAVPGPRQKPFLAITPHPEAYSSYLLQRSNENPKAGDFFASLHIAVLIGDAELVKLLLQYKASVDVKSDAKSTPLELAVVVNRPDLAALLLAAGADAKHVAPGGVRLTDFAIFRRNEEMYELLKKAGASVAGRSESGASALSHLGSAEVDDAYVRWVERLLNDGADPDGDEKFRPVNQAAARGSIAMIQLLKAKGADFTPDKADAPLPLVVKDGFTEAQLPAIKVLIEGGADTAARPGSNWNLLQAATSWIPDMKLMEELLALKPVPDGSWGRAKSEYDDAVMALQEAQVSPPPPGSKQVGGSSRSRSHKTKESQERVVKLAPALMRRLWDYEYLERNEQRTQRVWFQMLTNEKGEPDVTVPNKSGGPSSTLRLSFATFVPASPASEPVNVVEALVFAYGLARHEDRLRWPGGGFAPDFKRLTILRSDPATGQITRREPVDLVALAQQVEAPALPVLQPGDLLEAFGTERQASEWRQFPEPWPVVLRNMSGPRRVTVKAGDWQREFKLVPWMYQFRWDPATDILAIEPRVSQIIRYLPRPGYFYRLNAVRFVPKGKEPLTLDLSAPLFREKDFTLRDGDRIEIDEIPADDPGLIARRKQGLFVSREADGFLREVFHDPGTPEVQWSKELKSELMRRFFHTSESVLPFVDYSEVPVQSASGTAWGGCLELPRLKEEGEEWKLSNLAVEGLRISFTTGGGKTQAHDFWPKLATFRKTEDGWIGIVDRQLASRTLDEVVRAVTAGAADPAGWGQWEVLRPGRTEPLAVFSPGTGVIPFLLLQDGDTIRMSEADAARGQPPPVVSGDSQGRTWLKNLDKGLLSPPPDPNQNTLPRRRMVLPTREN